MQTIQNDTPRRLSNQQLTDKLIETLFTGKYTFTKAAELTGLKRNRAYRLFRKWKDTEEAHRVDSEWWSLYLQVRKKNPEKALECLTRIKHKLIVEKAEVKQEIREIKLEWNCETNDLPSA